MESTPLAFIIEDNEDQNWVFTLAMEQAGYRTESIHDGQLASKRLRETTPNLLILDLHIPGIPGDKLLSQVRADPQMGQTYVILATADAQKAEELQTMADLVLLKPISFAQLTDLASRYRGKMI
jgi:CheY-like chemotaxis protein